MESCPSEIVARIADYLDTSAKIRLASASKTLFYPVIAEIWKCWKSSCDLFVNINTMFKKPAKLFMDYRSIIISIHLTSDRREWLTGEQRLLPNFRIFAQGCKSLTILDLDIPCINNDDLWVITKSCINLSSLSLTSNSSTAGCLSDEGIQAICSNCPRLLHLMLEELNHTVFTERGMEIIAVSFGGNLKSFGLKYRQWFRSFSVQLDITPFHTDRGESIAKFAKSLGAIFQAHRNLENLHLDIPCSAELVLDFAANSLASLKSIRLMSRRASYGLQKLLHANRRLESLSLFEITLIDGMTLSHLLESTNDEVANPLLMRLELHSISQFKEAIPIIAKFTQLRYLSFEPSNQAAAIISTETPSVDSIARNCPLLQYIDMPIYRDEELIQFSKSCPRLTHLHVKDGRYITTNGITIMSSRLKLKYLNLGYAALNNLAVNALIKHQKDSLVEFYFSINSKVTNEMFLSLCKNCLKIESLSFETTTFDFATMKEAAGLLPRLKRITQAFPGGVQWTAREVEEIKMAHGPKPLVIILR